MNTLPLLVQDVERLRRHLLDVDGENRPWDSVLGGSWGCTLALAYAHSFPLYVRSMVLRGVCLFRSQEIHWLFGNPPPRDDSVVHTSNLRDLVSGGRSVSKKQSRPGATNTNAKVETASQLFSNAWKEFSKGVEVSTEQSTTPNNRDVLIQYYHRLLGSDPTIRARAAQSWFRWEMGIYSSVLPKQDHEITTNAETELLVWDPATKTWHYEDARVGTIHSVTSIDYDSIDVVQKKSVDDVAVQSLRRYSSPSPEQPVELEY
jgi:pimeloyl-ACP methyl ester carboxylesterase